MQTIDSPLPMLVGGLIAGPLAAAATAIFHRTWLVREDESISRSSNRQSCSHSLTGCIYRFPFLARATNLLAYPCGGANGTCAIGALIGTLDGSEPAPDITRPMAAD